MNKIQQCGPVIVRYSEPTHYDQAPQGTKCKVQTSSSKEKWYMQMSQDEEHPKWMEIE